MPELLGRQVLVVDPDDSLRALFRDLFTLEGFSVDAMSEIQPGALREYSPFAVVYGLGFGDEIAHIAVLRALLSERPADCAAFICTADPAQIANHQSALSSLGIPILSKPFDIEQLLRFIPDGVAVKFSVDGRLDGSGPS